MGCGASAHSAPKAKEQVAAPVKQKEAEVTWAVKKNSHESMGIAANMPAEAKESSGQGAKDNCMLLDADDSDIEIIYEGNHRNHQQAANAQEPPDAFEIEAVHMPKQQPYVEPKPLSKQQQEEAAKLAERRKRFDNQRYQQAVGGAPVPVNRTSPEPQSSVSFGSNVSTATGGSYPYSAPVQHQTNFKPITSPSLVNTKSVNDKPSHDMFMGLNFIDSQPRAQCCGPPEALPGGILDELEDLGKPIPIIKNQNKHDDLDDTGFDEEEEQIMKEILENFAD